MTYETSEHDLAYSDEKFFACLLLSAPLPNVALSQDGERWKLYIFFTPIPRSYTSSPLDGVARN